MQEASYPREISISVNGKPLRIHPETTLSDLLRSLDLPERGVAIEVNGKIIPKSQWGDYRLNTGDIVDLVQMMGGG
jgi:thiamine biosynthesis protein ThiS